MILKRQIPFWIVIALLVWAPDGWAAKSHSANAVLVIQGKVLDSAGNPVADANVVP
jgi:protocatechuate 3,4-dioxygenase beta subunit